MTAITRTYDARGLGCPMVMIELNKNINCLNKGEILEFISGEKYVQQDILSWSKRTGHVLLDTVEKNGASHYIIRVGERIRRLRHPDRKSPADNRHQKQSDALD